jgi:acyl-CoA reductase-like NAD-dependent aldehyde dehydrogenase
LTPSAQGGKDSGIPDALRAAVERTLDLAGRPARAGSAALDPERRSDALDEIARRGREARGEIARRGGQAREELGRRLELLERRLGSIEDLLREQGQAKGKSEG